MKTQEKALPECKDLDDYFADWEAHVFGFGYGTGERYVLGALKKFMTAIPVPADPDAYASYDYKDLEENCGLETTWLMINILGHHNVIEYGSSPRYGWLDHQSRALKDYVDARSVEDLVEATNWKQDYRHCSPDSCNCGPGFRCHNPFWNTLHGHKVVYTQEPKDPAANG